MIKSTTLFTMDGLYRKGDALLTGIQIILLLISLGMASWYSTWTIALVIGIPNVVICTLLTKVMPGARLTRVVQGLSLMVFAALIIHQSHGMLEFHFTIFVFLAFLLYYRDWLPIVAAAGLIAVHHLLFNYLQISGSPVYIFSANTGLGIVMIHAAFVVFETAFLVYTVLQTSQEGRQAEEVFRIAEGLTIHNGEIDLSGGVIDAHSPLGKRLSEYVYAVRNAIHEAKLASAALDQNLTPTIDMTRRAAVSARQQQQETDSLTSAMNEMTSSFQSVYSNATQASDFAVKAQKNSKNGVLVIKDSTDRMKQLVIKVSDTNELIMALEKESKEIGNVVDLISGIADQTNLLALNAAIEAARAGDAGRGFAVVADEVRTLASNTQQATDDIQKMISQLQARSHQASESMADSEQQATEGGEQIIKASEVLSEISSAVQDICDISISIAEATEQQSSVAEAINKNVIKIHDLSCDVDSSITQADKNAEVILELGKRLGSHVKRFKT